jgi:8-oxo-dGTP pyrophosphatase MutT (NUDIX family)
LGLILPGEVDEQHAERLLLIERSAELRSHAGQLAFPGGKPEPEDRDLLQTALREAQEEVGLDPSVVRVLGRLGEVPTPTGYMIIPFVGRVEGAWTPRRTSPEVRRILTPRLSHLAEPSIHRVTDRRRWRGRTWELHEYAIAEPPLWGATARMVWDLLSRMGES